MRKREKGGAKGGGGRRIRNNPSEEKPFQYFLMEEKAENDKTMK